MVYFPCPDSGRGIGVPSYTASNSKPPTVESGFFCCLVHGVVKLDPIRKTGSYSAATLAPAEQLQIRKAISARALRPLSGRKV